MMAHRSVTLTAVPSVLVDALQATLALTPSSEGQKTAQRKIATAMIAVGSFHIEKSPADTRGSLKEGSLHTSPMLRENMFRLWIRPPDTRPKYHL